MSDLVLKSSGGANIVLWPMALQRPYPPATAPPASVEVWWSYDDETFANARFVGHFAPGQSGSFPYTPDADRDVRLYAVSRSASGTPHVSTLEDAVQVTVLFRRETEAPVIGQNKPATAAELEIGITGFTRFARYRRVTISANADMSDPLAVLLFDSAAYAAHELPRYLTLSRTVGVLTTEAGLELETEDGSKLTTEDDATTLPRTVYITVAHSGGAAWTPESAILEATFAGVDGTPGSPGDFDPVPRDKEHLDLIV
jgi:hypothetical protein